MKKTITLLLLAACVGPKLATVAPAPTGPAVKATNGPVCQGGNFPADAPCLEQGEIAPHGGLLLTPDRARADDTAQATCQAENASLKKSNALDVGLVAAAVVAILAAGYGGFELGRALK